MGTFFSRLFGLGTTTLGTASKLMTAAEMQSTKLVMESEADLVKYVRNADKVTAEERQELKDLMNQW